MRYPEHEKLQALKTERAIVQQFLDWLDEDRGAHPQVVYDDDGIEVARIPKAWVIAMYPTITHGRKGTLNGKASWYESDNLMLAPPNTAGIIGMFLGIDPQRLEEEKRAMLAEMRKEGAPK